VIKIKKSMGLNSKISQLYNYDKKELGHYFLKFFIDNKDKSFFLGKDFEVDLDVQERKIKNYSRCLINYLYSKLENKKIVEENNFPLGNLETFLENVNSTGIEKELFYLLKEYKQTDFSMIENKVGFILKGAILKYNDSKRKKNLPKGSYSLFYTSIEKALKEYV
jgi:hypothetical protein